MPQPEPSLKSSSFVEVEHRLDHYPRCNHSLRHRFVFVLSQDQVTLARRGLDPSVLRSIPVLVYRPEDFKEGLECAVCLCDMAEDEKMRILPKCNHGFHVECIDMWFQSHYTCPLCWNPINSEYNVAGGESGGVESSSGGKEMSENEPDVEASHLPINMLFWGNKTRVSSRNGLVGGTNHEEPLSFSQESSSLEDRRFRPKREKALVIEIPKRLIEDMESSLSPSTSRCPLDELKSPVTRRLRSLRRFQLMLKHADLPDGLPHITWWHSSGFDPRRDTIFTSNERNRLCKEKTWVLINFNER